MTYSVQTFETGFIPGKYENTQGRTVWEITATKGGLHLLSNHLKKCPEEAMKCGYYHVI